jgi:hypothetical protein
MVASLYLGGAIILDSSLQLVDQLRLFCAERAKPSD